MSAVAWLAFGAGCLVAMVGGDVAAIEAIRASAGGVIALAGGLLAANVALLALVVWLCAPD